MAETNKVIVTGAGHSGTNIVLEGLRSSGVFEFMPNDGKHTEDRHLNLRYKDGLSKNYGTKLCTENDIVTVNLFCEVLTKYPDTEVVFLMRNPIDIALTRIFQFRGTEGFDAEGNIKHLEHTADILDFLWTSYYYRTNLVFLPDLLKDFEGSMKTLCSELNIPYNTEISYAYRKTRIMPQKRKYGGIIDLKQCNLLAHESEIFGNYWTQNEQQVLWKHTILDYFKNDFEVWKDRPSYIFWKTLLEG